MYINEEELNRIIDFLKRKHQFKAAMGLVKEREKRTGLFPVDKVIYEYWVQSNEKS